MAIAELAPPRLGAEPKAARGSGWPPWATLSVMLGLYVVAAALLLVRLDAHPSYAYNWEAYTAYGVFAFWDRPTLGIFRATGGLMTDSSFSPLVILPSWLAFKVGGVGLLSLRVATALLAAAAVPLLWWTGRHFVGSGAALLAAALLALSPVFLLYGRTATLVGLSLGPALVAIEALRRVLHHPADRRWLWILLVALIVGGYCYAPIRFLWPIAVLFLGLEHRRRPEARAALHRAIVLTVFVPWLAITVALLHDPFTALFAYYEGRGEHVLGLSFEPRQYGSYLRADPGEGLGDNPVILAARLVAQNGGDLVNLLIDRHTAPALTDYWNARGRLYPAFLAPFFALGLAVTAREARRSVEARLLLVLAAAWTLPMLITSRVHIGRLIFFLPILCLIVATGAMWPLGKLIERGLSWQVPRRAARAGSIAATLLAAALVTLVAAATWRDYRQSPPLPADAAAAAPLREAAASAPEGIALILRPHGETDPTDGVGEATQVAAMRLGLDAAYRFVDLYPPGSRPPLPTTDGRPPLYHGDILGRLGRPTERYLPCETIFYVAPGALEQFVARLEQRREACGEPRFVVLP